jgi:hypothetical protein
LVPSGKKLSDVALDLELLGALTASLMLAVFVKHPDVAIEVLADLQGTQQLPRLSQRQKQTFTEAIKIAQRFAAEAAGHYQ